MDKERFRKICSNYIDKFDEINKKNEEYYKWELAAQFHAMMNEALAAPADVLAERLRKIVKMTGNFIDSYTQPFYGLTAFAEKEPETVRQMFFDLFADDEGDLDKRLLKIQNFKNQSDALKEKYYPDSFRYENELHSIMGYLFLYDPDHNFMYKYTECREMAEHVGFAGGWDSGLNFKIKIFYQFCNQLIAEIKSNEELLRLDAGRQKYTTKPLHPDKEKHILLFDIIYDAHYMNLYSGVKEDVFSAAEQREYNEKHLKAVMYYENYLKAKADQDRLDEAASWADEIFKPGARVKHIQFGMGTVLETNRLTIRIQYDEGAHKLQNIGALVGLRMLEPENNPNFEENVENYRPVLKEFKKINENMKQAEKDFVPFSEYLD